MPTWKLSKEVMRVQVNALSGTGVASNTTYDSASFAANEAQFSQMLREAERKALSDYIETKGLKVQRLLNTHLHLDHILGNAFVARTYGVQPEAHEEDAF